jgi:hypothetical protein
MNTPHTLPPGPYIEKLEDELEIARDRVKELEQALGIGDDLMPLRHLGLSPQQARLVNAIHKRSVVTKAQAMMAIYAADDDRRFDVLPKILDTIVCNARHRLRRFGVSFETINGREDEGGYRMTDRDKSRLDGLLASGVRWRLRPERKMLPERPIMRRAAHA